MRVGGPKIRTRIDIFVSYPKQQADERRTQSQDMYPASLRFVMSLNTNQMAVERTRYPRELATSRQRRKGLPRPPTT